ncbi:carboxy-terminal kinesin 2-like [Lytechinus variegatus]|uniref:carboxy-terminal kinesin 2-like n=1 Tax=Lytechinus variegatus TaxID=7654 RepID=UPI001BB0DC3E|nr:carboxy-terminal kinesin 2-like [Lytechinus variegatus]
MSRQGSALSTQDPNVVSRVSKLRPPSKLPTKLPQPGFKRALVADNQAENAAPEKKKTRLDTTEAAPARRPALPAVRKTGPAVTARGGTAKPISKPVAARPGLATAKPRVGAPSKPAAPSKSAPKSRAAPATTRPGTRTTAPPPSKTAGTKSKRQPWDLKGRLADMEAAMGSRIAANQDLEGRITENNDRIAYLESLNQQLKGTVQIKESLSNQAEETIRSLERKLRDAEDEHAIVERRLNREKEDLEMTRSSLKRQMETLEGDLSASRQECSGLKSSIASMTAAQAGYIAQLDATKHQLEQSVESGRQKDTRISDLEAEVEALKASVAEKESRIRDEETIRRKLHNTIQELKGNIRVFCRVRPLLSSEQVAGDDIPHINFPDVDGKTLVLDKLSDVSLNESTMSTRNGRNGTSHYEFNFDRVFEPVSKQSEVFEEISQLVQSTLDGYNVCIFAYGQTGSGKTYTMEGPEEVNEENVGMIPRAVQQVFTTAADLEEKGWKYTFQASFLEIYNETIRDLLGSPNSKVKHEVRMVEAKSSEVEVTNINIVDVTSENQVNSLLHKASQNRAVAATNCNERSSRSHSVFRLKLTGQNQITSENCQGTLNLVDLAGSERLSSSGSTGDRLKETQNINKSLSNLGKVILALANKDSHIPYRNSKLTHLLQNSLGGNSKTLMFVNISPKEENFQETLCSLRFATKVNQCNIGTAQKKIK